MIPEQLPELNVLIPSVLGSVYSYMGTTYLAPEFVSDASKVPDHGIVRHGFRLYEILEWNSTHKAWKVRQFSATLTDLELAKLTGGELPDVD